MADVKTPEAYTDPATGQQLIGYPIIQNGAVIGHTPLTAVELSTLGSQNMTNPKNIETYAQQAGALDAYNYATAGTGAITNDMRIAAVESATGKPYTGAGLLPENNGKPLLQNIQDAQKPAATAAPATGTQYLQRPDIKPRVETLEDGTQIVTMKGSYLHDMVRNFYKAGAASATVSTTPAVDAKGNPMPAAPAATAQVNAPIDPARVASPTGGQQIKTDDYSTNAANNIFNQLRNNPNNKNMSDAAIWTALSGKK